MGPSSESIADIDDALERESKRKVEAALFIAGKFMTLPELVHLTGVNPLLLKKILVDLQDSYRASGITIVHQQDVWKMDVAPEFISLVNVLATGESEFSKAEQESLAIIAYKQPLKQSILIKIRGNKAYDHIKRFLAMGLIVRTKLGHTWELKLSEHFHEYFHTQQGDLSEFKNAFS
jgi:segregation and condensation protein B